MRVTRIKEPAPQTVLVKNTSSFPILLTTHQQDAMRYEVLSTTRLKLTPLKEAQAQINLGDVFYAQLPDGKQVVLGVVGLLRTQSDQAGWNYCGHVEDATLQPGTKGILKVGTPTQYRDDNIFAQKTTLRTHMGGVPWVDIVNETNVPLTFYDGPTYPAPSFTVNPGDTYRYKGRASYGVNYGTYISNLEGLFDKVQVLSPITHLLYGVL
jgi:hypothetical protein